MRYYLQNGDFRDSYHQPLIKSIKGKGDNMNAKITFKKVGTKNDKGEVWIWYQAQLEDGLVGKFSSKTDFAVGEEVVFEIRVSPKDTTFYTAITKKGKA